MPSMIAITVVVGTVGAGVAGVVALAVGMIGRRVDDHPTCRACGFDLIGRGATAGAVLGAPCSECGKPIVSEKDVRVGTRVRRRGALTAGMLLLTLALLVAIPFVIVPLAGQTASKPTWLLLVEAEYGTTKLQETAADELMNRHVAGKLPAADGLRLVQLAAAVHANTNVAFTKVWREIMHDDVLFAMLPQATREAAAVRGVEPFLKVRTKVRSGKGVPVPMGIGLAGNERALRANDRVLHLREVRWSIVDAAGKPVEFGVITEWSSKFQLMDMPGASTWSTHNPACNLEPGTYTVVAEIDGFLMDKNVAWGPEETRPADGLRVNLVRRGTIEALPAGEESVAIVEDDALLQSIKPHFTFKSMGSVRQPTPYGEVRFGVEVKGHRGDLTKNQDGLVMVWGADLLFPDTREVVPGAECHHSIQVPLNASVRGATVMFEIERPVPPGKYVLRLRADRSRAEKTEYITKILGGEMEFEVELEEWPKATP
jgi:hypothetical protein